MQQLQGQVHTYTARDGGTVKDKAFRDKLLQNCIAPETVTLKIGAQVMLIKNLDETLVNGSLGRVHSFMTEQRFADWNENEDSLVENGVKPYDEEARARQKAEILGLDTQRVYPVVCFSLLDGTFRRLLCKPESWRLELPNGEVQASREQVPLILAWALSIHKAQGQTLDRVKVDLGRVFEKGQAYVALSRATTMDGLQVLRFDAKKVMAHDKVRNFYAGLSKVEQASMSKSKRNLQRGADVAEYDEGCLDDYDDSDYDQSYSHGMG
jgi:ATP-dependent DNA helicase PIF1